MLPTSAASGKTWILAIAPAATRPETCAVSFAPRSFCGNSVIPSILVGSAGATKCETRKCTPLSRAASVFKAVSVRCESRRVWLSGQFKGQLYPPCRVATGAIVFVRSVTVRDPATFETPVRQGIRASTAGFVHRDADWRTRLRLRQVRLVSVALAFDAQCSEASPGGAGGRGRRRSAGIGEN